MPGFYFSVEKKASHHKNRRIKCVGENGEAAIAAKGMHDIPKKLYNLIVARPLKPFGLSSTKRFEVVPQNI